MNWGSPHRTSYFRAAHAGCWVSLDHFGDVHGSPGKQRFGHGRLLRIFTQLVTLRVTPRCGEIGDSFNISLQGSAQLSVIPLLRWFVSLEIPTGAICTIPIKPRKLSRAKPHN